MAKEPSMLSVTPSAVAPPSAAPPPAPFTRTPSASPDSSAPSPFASALSAANYPGTKAKSAASSAPRSFDSVNPPKPPNTLRSSHSASSPSTVPVVPPAQIVPPDQIVPPPAGQVPSGSSSDASTTQLASVFSNPDLRSTLLALTTSPANPSVGAVPAANADLTANLPQVQPNSAQDGTNLASASTAPTATPANSIDVPIQPIVPAAFSGESAPPSDALAVQVQQAAQVAPQVTEPDKSSAPSEAHNNSPEAADTNVFLGAIQAPVVQASPVPLAVNAPVSGQSNSHEKVSAATKASAPQTAATVVASAGASAKQLAASGTPEQPAAPSAIGGQADANQQQAQNRDKLALEITARLHSPFGDAQPTPAPNSTTPLVDASAIPPGAQPANASTSNSASSDSVKPANSDSASSSAGQPGSGDNNSQNSNASSNLNGSSLAAANGPGAFAVASADFSRHVTTPEALVSPQTSADAASTASTQRTTSAALLSSQQPTLPPSLPTSLNDVVQASRLYQRVGGAEMHIAMDTDLLGSIDLRAVLHQSGLTATIGVQHADVQALLSSELPGLQHALSEKNLHVEQISIFGSAVGSQSNHGGSQNQQQKQTPAFAPQAAAAWSGSSNSPGESLVTVSDAGAVGGTGRLSVHA